MKNRILKLSSIVLTAIVVMTISSCKKKDPAATDTSTISSSDNNTSETNSNDINNIGSQAIENGSLSTMRLANGSEGIFTAMSGSANINLDSTNKKVTVTFTAFLGK